MSPEKTSFRLRVPVSRVTVVPTEKTTVATLLVEEKTTVEVGEAATRRIWNYNVVAVDLCLRFRRLLNSGSPRCALRVRVETRSRIMPR